MKIQLGRLGGQLGVGFCVAGLLALILGWNGAASYNRVPAQFPYLISGGLVGLSLVVIGAGLLIVQAGREGRARLEATIVDLQRTVERMAASAAVGAGAGTAARPEVVAGPTAFHRPDCRLVQGREELAPLTMLAAEEQGLKPCRVCNPTGS